MSRRSLPVALTLLALAGCGDDRPAPSPLPAATPPAAEARKQGEREVISSEDEALQRAQVLAPRDVPLAIGASAPAFEGYPARTKAVIVFFRGEW